MHGDSGGGSHSMRRKWGRGVLWFIAGYLFQEVPHGSLIKFDQICCHSVAVDTRLRAKLSELHFRSHDVPDMMVCDDVRDFFSWFFHPLVQSVLFHASVAMLVRVLGRLLGGWGRVCVLLFKKRPGGSTCYPHPWELVSTFYLHLSVVSKYSFLLLTNPVIVLATFRASLFHITPPNQF